MTRYSNRRHTHLLERELPHVRRYAQSLTRCPDEGEDLAQTVMERAIARWEQFRPGTSLRRWLFTITRNAHIDSCRKRSRRGGHVPIEDWYHETQCAPAQDKHVELKDVAGQIRQLRPEERNIIQLSVINGLSHQTIADRLGIAEGTVKSRLSRARQALGRANSDYAAAAK